MNIMEKYAEGTDANNMRQNISNLKRDYIIDRLNTSKISC